MKQISINKRDLVKDFFRNERGLETIEHAIIAGLITVGVNYLQLKHAGFLETKDCNYYGWGVCKATVCNLAEHSQ